MGGNGQNTNLPEDIVIGGDDKFGNPKEHWEDSHDAPSSNNVSQLYELPGIDNMAAVIERGIFKSDDEADAIVLMAYLNDKYDDKKHQQLLRMKIARTIGQGGAGRVEALFGATNLVAPDMYRVARGMPKAKGEKVHRSSDFRTEGRDKEFEDRSV